MSIEFNPPEFDYDSLDDGLGCAAAAPTRPRSTCELVGAIDRFLFCSDDHTFIIAKLERGEIIKGSIEGEPLELGVSYRLLGRWDRHPRHGDQFQFSTVVKDQPHDRAGIIKYLSSECTGIGAKRADALWALFGSEAVSVLRATPDRVIQSGCLSEEIALKASKELQAVAAMEKTKIDLFTLFAGRGFPGKILNACIKRWGARAADHVKRNPWALLVHELPGAGFKRCDKLYLDLGYPASRLKRQMLCLWNAIRSDSNGHTWHLATRIAQSVIDAVGLEKAQPVKAAKLGKRAKWLASRKDENGQVWLAEAKEARSEWTIAEKIIELLGE